MLGKARSSGCTRTGFGVHSRDSSRELLQSLLASFQIALEKFDSTLGLNQVGQNGLANDGRFLLIG
jgi:hypothetical protein